MNNFFQQKRFGLQRNYGFITETPLNFIQEKKMSRDKNNPLINYQKNLRNTVRFSKKFYTNSTVQTTENEETLNDETLPLEKNLEKELEQEQCSRPEIKNYDVIKHLNPMFLSRTNDLVLKFQKNETNYEKTLKNTRPITEIQKLRQNRLCLNPRKLLTLNQNNNVSEPLSVETDRDQLKRPLLGERSDPYVKDYFKFSNIDSMNTKKDESGVQNLTIDIENKEVPQLNLKLKTNESHYENERVVSPSLGINSPSLPFGSPTLKTFETFKDLSKLELRKQIFRKYSINKREKKPIVQLNNHFEPEADIKKEEFDFEMYVKKRKEFEMLYEDDLFKIGYFDNEIEGKNEIIRRKKEKASGLIQRNMGGGARISMIKMKNHFKKDIESGTKKLYEKYCLLDNSIPNEKTNGREFAPKLEKTDSFLRAQENLLTFKEIIAVKEEFKKSDPDFELLDSYLRILKFFLRFDEKTRVNLLKESTFQEFKPGEIIFNQGDFGNYMYVILKGAVNIRKNRTSKNGHMQNIVINTLYDGDLFGELAMMGTNQKKEKNVQDLTKNVKDLKEEAEKEDNEKNNNEKDYIERTKRMATTQAAETTSLLAISRDYFKTILLSTTQKELDDKLTFLMGIPCLSVFEAHTLIPLANYLSLCYFASGEIIVKEGERPSCLYIIKQGACKLVKSLPVKRDLCPSIYTKGLRKALPCLNFGTKAAIDLKKKIKNQDESDETHRSSRILFSDPKIIESEEKIHYNDMIEYGNLVEGDMIGQRAIFDLHKLAQNQLITPRINEIEEAKLSVIADSNMVEILKLERKALEFIPESLKIALSKEVQSSVEFDENIYVEIDLENNKIWNKFKESFTKDLIKNDALKKNAKDFYKMY